MSTTKKSSPGGPGSLAGHGSSRACDRAETGPRPCTRAAPVPLPELATCARAGTRRLLPPSVPAAEQPRKPWLRMPARSHEQRPKHGRAAPGVEWAGLNGHFGRKAAVQLASDLPARHRRQSDLAERIVSRSPSPNTSTTVPPRNDERISDRRDQDRQHDDRRNVPPITHESRKRATHVRSVRSRSIAATRRAPQRMKTA
jgi:hypothetical protein